MRGPGRFRRRPILRPMRPLIPRRGLFFPPRLGCFGLFMLLVIVVFGLMIVASILR